MFMFVTRWNIRKKCANTAWRYGMLQETCMACVYFYNVEEYIPSVHQYIHIYIYIYIRQAFGLGRVISYCLFSIWVYSLYPPPNKHLGHKVEASEGATLQPRSQLCPWSAASHWPQWKASGHILAQNHWVSAARTIMKWKYSGEKQSAIKILHPYLLWKRQTL